MRGGGSRRAWSSSTAAADLPWSGGPARDAARGAANPAGRVPGRRGRRDLGRGAGEIGLGLARGGGGREARRSWRWWWRWRGRGEEGEGFKQWD